MRPRITLMIALLLSIVVSGTAVSSTVLAEPTGESTDPAADAATDTATGAATGAREPGTARGDHTRVPPPAPAPQPDLSAAVTVTADGFLTWAVLDRTTGETASAGDERNTTESMIKIWIVADHLREAAAAGLAPSEQALDDAERAIRDSDNEGTQRLYVAGGGDEVVARMIEQCGLRDTTVHPGWWSRTEISAEDAVRLGECVVDGTAAGPQWTDWVLAQMRQVRGTTAEEDQRPQERFEGGRWGIIDGLPEEVRDDVAIKNGWTRIGDTDSWHLNCLAVTDDWVMAILMRYPAAYSLDYGADRCAEVTAQLFDAPTADDPR